MVILQLQTIMIFIQLNIAIEYINTSGNKTCRPISSFTGYVPETDFECEVKSNSSCSVPTNSPSLSPTLKPSLFPTVIPTLFPTNFPTTAEPTQSPTSINFCNYTQNPLVTCTDVAFVIGDFLSLDKTLLECKTLCDVTPSCRAIFFSENDCSLLAYIGGLVSRTDSFQCYRKTVVSCLQTNSPTAFPTTKNPTLPPSEYPITPAPTIPPGYISHDNHTCAGETITNSPTFKPTISPTEYIPFCCVPDPSACADPTTCVDRRRLNGNRMLIESIESCEGLCTANPECVQLSFNTLTSSCELYRTYTSIGDVVNGSNCFVKIT